ncbi:uncharacterized protein LOC128612075 [Ictalurus furcatus]|uniref:uncharacterized protein LOC128612075 n=1 Tax=Ictalurus furcatus TaxID=66913 RepID=UPI0023505394|nr:uncharacterized protein LOC128612075 [Ictalurus furcatus]
MKSLSQKTWCFHHLTTFQQIDLNVISPLKMTPMWILVLSLNIITPSQSVDFSRPSFLSVKSGERVTLKCHIGDIRFAESVFWYKQTFGEMPQKVGDRLAYKDAKMSPMFKASGFIMEVNDNSISLTIPHIKIEHGGLYSCAKCYMDDVTLSSGTLLVVTGDEDVKVSVFQSGMSDSVPAGASVTLQCSVLSESRSAELQVLWFRAAPPQSHPQIIYTHHNSSHQCESGSSTHTCVYNFSKNILSLNDTGTYYCAVAMCGKIIFGNGTRVQLATGESVDPVVICLAIALGVCVVVIVAHIVTCKWRNCECCIVRSEDTVVKETQNQSRDAVELNFAALHINKRRGKRERARDNVYTEVIYSSVS